MSINAVLFDLDGTLLDTAGDLIAALNHIMQEDNVAPINESIMRKHVSQGAKAMISVAYDCDTNSDLCQQRWQRLVNYYAQNINIHTGFFATMDNVLDTLEASGIKWGIVTNKPAFLTDPLMQRLGLDQRTKCIVSGDTLAYSKPHPAPVLHACDLLGCRPEETVFVGDDERDIVAGREAGTKTLAACYGYILDSDNPYQWNADMCIDSPLQILDWIQQYRPLAPYAAEPVTIC